MTQAPPGPPPDALDDWRTTVGVPPHVVCLFFRQLAILLSSSIHIVKSLETLSQQDECPIFGVVIQDIAYKVHQGGSLSEQMSYYPRIFPSAAVTVVRMGERGGGLDDSLERLSTWLERDYQLWLRVKSALFYPMFVLILATFLTLSMFYTVLPSFLGIFADLKVPLPTLTRGVLLMTEAVRQPGVWLLLAALLGGAYIGGSKLLKTKSGRATFFRGLRRVPILGDLLVKGGCARYCMCAQAMLASGMDLISTLNLAASASGHPELDEDSAVMEDAIKGGRPCSTYMLSRPEIYPPTMGHMVMAGEEVSRLPDMFGRVGGYFDVEMSYQLDAFTAALEPLMLTMVASVVAVVVMSIFLPLYSFLGTIAS